ncbi:DUF5305 family protein [Actinoplanes philippinensis]|uniref:DUF5305 family protein n=1 Tax=Actinoplanes philippinensis TaxID=35752 RepID=UPI0033D64F1E
MAAIFAMAAIGAWAISTHRLSYVVTHGVSMQPTYHAKDLVILIRFDSYEVGQIAAYHGSHGRLEVLHRIIGGDGATGFTFRGDNNKSIDPETPTAAELIGRAVLHVPKGGVWLQPVLSPTGLGMLGFLFVSGGAATAKTRREIPRGRRKKKVKAMGNSLASAVAVTKAVWRLHPMMRLLAVVSAACAVSGFALGVLGWMGPAAEKASSIRAGESMTFSYSADVGNTAAYDSTTAYSPDPIFRNVAQLVDLHLTYRGRPGRIGITARLSTGNGWHSVIELSPTRPFTAAQYMHTAQLDLNGLDQRAQAAAKAVGTDPGPVAVTVTARVERDDGSVFEPQLSLTFDALQLTLTNGATSLVVDGSSNAAASDTLQPRRIPALGITATQSRSYAVTLLLVALAGTAAIIFGARSGAPLRTRPQIERRYPHLIVPVEPMASPPGKPVVIVDTFPALVKLAEKYGQMILTWTRPDGADDFVVRDEGILYRYRIEPSAAPTPPKPEPRPASATASVQVAAETAPAPVLQLPPAPEPPPDVQPEPLGSEDPAATEEVPAKKATPRKRASRTTAAKAAATKATATKRAPAKRARAQAKTAEPEVAAIPEVEISPDTSPTPTADEQTADEPRADQLRADEPRADQPRADEQTADEPKADEQTADELTVDEPKADEPKADAEKGERSETTDPKTAEETTPATETGKQPEPDPVQAVQAVEEQPTQEDRTPEAATATEEAEAETPAPRNQKRTNRRKRRSPQPAMDEPDRPATLDEPAPDPATKPGEPPTPAEAAREAMADLADRNSPIERPEPDPNREPIYDFLPATKRSPAPPDPDEDA